MRYKLGRRPSKPDPRTLRFGDYLIPKGFAPPPTAVDWYTRVKSWPMDGNDTLGDCVIAALAHQQNAWTAYAAGIEGGPTLAEVESVYKTLSPDDTGCDMLTAIKYVAKNGLGGGTIAAYVSLGLKSHYQAKTAIELFGGIFLGLALPDAVVMAKDPLAVPWSVPTPPGPVGRWAPNQNNGHAIIAPGYRGPKSHFDVVTWGALIGMGWSFYDAYVDEAYALVSTEWIAANGTSPSGFNLDQLLADVSAIRSIH